MKVFLMPEFLQDLAEADDPRFVKRVIGQILNDEGTFRRDKDDHRFHGFEDLWIRYISRGKTAYRLLYVQRDDFIYLYRAGPHSIEDEAKVPTRYDAAVPVDEAGRTRPMSVRSARPPQWDDGLLLKTQQEPKINKILRSMTEVGHRRIILISPFIDKTVLASRAPLGRFLNLAIEEDTEVEIVTRPPSGTEINFFEDLERRDIFVYFHHRIHAKLYLFDVNEATLNQYTRDTKPTAIIGSANLTEKGVALTSDNGNEELCFRLPITKFGEAWDYALWLINQSTDLTTQRAKLMRRQ